MTVTIEVFADICCPFTHVGLKRVVDRVEHLATPVEIVVRAWPLEWVNGSAMEADAVAEKIDVLRVELGVDDFDGFRAERWPATTIPALNLADAAYDIDRSTGLEVSLRLRSLLFEDGIDVSEPAALATLAAELGLPTPADAARPGVVADYADGQRRGVQGSPEFWVGDDHFFCPSLELGHDEHGKLTASFDQDGLHRFLDAIDDRA